MCYCGSRVAFCVRAGRLEVMARRYVSRFFFFVSLRFSFRSALCRLSFVFVSLAFVYVALYVLSFRFSFVFRFSLLLCNLVSFEFRFVSVCLCCALYPLVFVSFRFVCLTCVVSFIFCSHRNSSGNIAAFCSGIKTATSASSSKPQ